MIPYDAVLFDLDGTLTASHEGIFNCVRYAAERMGLPQLPPAELRTFIGPPLVHSFQVHYGLTEAEGLRALEIYRERFNDVGLFENRVYPGIRQLLQMLRQAGCWVAVATAKPQGPTERILDHFHLTRYFDRVVGVTPQETKAEKEAIIRKALPAAYTPAAMVGDRRYDMEGAAKAGVTGIGAVYGYGSRAELEAAGAAAWAEDVEALTALLCPGVPRPRGAFVTMEGLDGSGKTTQMDLLADGLDRMGYRVVRSREPGGCPIAEKIRALVLDKVNVGMAPVTEALLYAASRAQHVGQVLRPAVEAGKLMLCDRFVDSSVAYQGGGRQLGVEAVTAINAPAVAELTPDVTVYLDLPAQAALARRRGASDPDRIEGEDLAFHRRVEAAYRQIMAGDAAGRFVVADAALPPQALGERVLEEVLIKLGET